MVALGSWRATGLGNMKRMANRILSADELQKATGLLDEIRDRLKHLAADDPTLLFAFRRKVMKELGYDERGKPVHRIRLKAVKMGEQQGKCAECGEALPERYAVLDRKNAIDGYTAANTELIHAECDQKRQLAKRYT
jgi:hypothetical protein